MAARRDQQQETEHDSTPPLKSLLRTLRGLRRFAVIPLILALFGAGAWLMWKRFGDQVLAHESFQLTPDKIQFTQPPRWLERDILAEVVRLGSLETLNLHEPELTVRVASAFELHPWVKTFQKAYKKYPAGVVVQLEYRSPVAMVVLPDDDPTDNEAWIQPIDAEAVLLPGPDFTPEQARKYPRILVGETLPVGPVGARWGDPAIAKAAKLADLLHSRWDSLSDALYQIQLNDDSTPAVVPDFDIVGRPQFDGVPDLIVHWGRAPGEELAGEPTAAKKLARLRTWITRVRKAAQPLVGRLDLRTSDPPP